MPDAQKIKISVVHIRDDKDQSCCKCGRSGVTKEIYVHESTYKTMKAGDFPGLFTALARCGSCKNLEWGVFGEEAKSAQ